MHYYEGVLSSCKRLEVMESSSVFDGNSKEAEGPGDQDWADDIGKNHIRVTVFLES